MLLVADFMICDDVCYYIIQELVRQLKDTDDVRAELASNSIDWEMLELTQRVDSVLGKLSFRELARSYKSVNFVQKQIFRGSSGTDRRLRYEEMKMYGGFTHFAINNVNNVQVCNILV